MPVKIKSNLPAREILENENIFVMDETRSEHQDIRPIEIGILNLMPLKEDNELQTLRSLSNTPLQVNVTFLTVSSHESAHTSQKHLDQFYVTLDESRDRNLDGLIITGAPVEHMDFEEVDYWDEVCEIMDWAKTHVTSTLHVCWGAQAGLYHYYGIKKHQMEKEVFGVYEHQVMNRKIPLVRGFDDYFMAPHPRHTEMRREDIEAVPELKILASSEQAGVYAIMNKGGRQIFVTGHSEYDPETLRTEYLRDKNQGLPISVPENYFPDDDDTKEPIVRWRSHANLLFSNWLNYFVYQTTPYDIMTIGENPTDG